VIWKTAGLSLLFPIAAWIFMGRFGLIVAGVVLVSWVLAPGRAILWALAIASLAAAPAVIVLQGLLSPRAVGPLFGAQHMLANRLVQVALAYAAFAATVDGLRLRPPATRERVVALVKRLSQPLHPAQDDEGAGDQKGGGEPRP
jgi:hypothetical protein